MGHHLSPGFQDFGDDIGGHLPVGDLDRRLDHGKGKALNAVAVMQDIAFFRGQQPLGQVILVGVVAEQ